MAAMTSHANALLRACFVGVVFAKNIIFLFLRDLSLCSNYVLCKLVKYHALQSVTIGSDVISSFRHDQLMFFNL